MAQGADVHAQARGRFFQPKDEGGYFYFGEEACWGWRVHGSVHSPDPSPNTQDTGRVLVLVSEVWPLRDRVSAHVPEPQLPHLYNRDHDGVLAPHTFSRAPFSPLYARVNDRIVGPKLHHRYVPVGPRKDSEFHPDLEACVMWGSGTKSLKESLTASKSHGHAPK